jgi:hypothetical protein
MTENSKRVFCVRKTLLVSIKKSLSMGLLDIDGSSQKSYWQAYVTFYTNSDFKLLAHHHLHHYCSTLAALALIILFSEMLKKRSLNMFSKNRIL